MKCKNCGCKVDKFLGRDTRAIIYLHVKEFKIDNDLFWSWVHESDKKCSNPEPELDEKDKV